MKRIICVALSLSAIVFVLLGSSVCSATCEGGDRYASPTPADGTVMDCNTGLIWLKNAHCTVTINGVQPYPADGTLKWYAALRWVSGLKDGLCGLADGSASGAWRLPTKTELMAMVAYAKQQGYTNPTLTNALGNAQWTPGNAFDNVQSGGTWSSTTASNSFTDAWLIDMSDGTPARDDKSGYRYLWPVRGVQAGSFDTLIIQ